MEVVKVQLPIESSSEEVGDLILLYGENRKKQCLVVSPELKHFMQTAGRHPYMKAYVWGEWDGRRKQWVLDLSLGFAPTQAW